MLCQMPNIKTCWDLDNQWYTRVLVESLELATSVTGHLFICFVENSFIFIILAAKL